MVAIGGVLLLTWMLFFKPRPRQSGTRVNLPAAKAPVRPAYETLRRSGLEPVLSRISEPYKWAAVVKVPPLMGCVKYKAQHIVLPVGIPVFTRHSRTENGKNPRFCCGISRIEAPIAVFKDLIFGVFGLNF